MNSGWPAAAAKLDQIERLAREGWSEQAIAEKLGITISTFLRYKNEHQELREVLKKGQDEVDAKVENALLKRALGYETEEIKTYIEEDASGKKRKRIEKIQRTIPPDVDAQIYWLKNRQKNQWNEKLNFPDSDKFPVKIDDS